ncbi:MAG: hypothetical protein QM535_09420 [Limnohabitans sp.]|nr:hypothetical protein [Limnohabitans sp.]
MRKVILLAGMLALCTSCTYEDVVNYLSGRPNNLTQEEQKCVDDNRNNPTYTTEVDKDKGDVKPPRG